MVPKRDGPGNMSASASYNIPVPRGTGEIVSKRKARGWRDWVPLEVSVQTIVLNTAGDELSTYTMQRDKAWRDEDPLRPIFSVWDEHGDMDMKHGVLLEANVWGCAFEI